MEYQVTLFDKTNKYKPVSTIVKSESIDKTLILKLGAEKICRVRNWSKKELEQYNYKVGKIREYNPQKIAEENVARYQKIKEEKYASGEWKRPKKEKK